MRLAGCCQVTQMGEVTRQLTPGNLNVQFQNEELSPPCLSRWSALRLQSNLQCDMKLAVKVKATFNTDKGPTQRTPFVLVSSCASRVL